MRMSQFYSPFQRMFRKRRMEQFVQIFGVSGDTRIIDVGGYELNWTLVDASPSVLLVNLENEHWKRGRFEKRRVMGDALSMPI